MEKYIKIVRDYYKKHLTLFEDRIFKEAAENKEFIQELLRVILDDKKLIVLSVSPQKEFNVLNQHGVRLDCYCKFQDGSVGNVEVERNEDKDDNQKRVRYYGSMIDVKNLKEGQKYSELPNVYMVYLTIKDIFKEGKTIYHVERQLVECNKYVDNGYHEIYVNAEVDDKSEIAEVMKILSTKDYVNEKFKTISKVKEEKTMPAEVEYAMEQLKKEYRNEGRQEGRLEGRLEGKIEGRQEGRLEGKQEGRLEGESNTFIKLFKQGIISEDVVLNNLRITKEEFDKRVKDFNI